MGTDEQPDCLFLDCTRTLELPRKTHTEDPKPTQPPKHSYRFHVLAASGLADSSGAVKTEDRFGITVKRQASMGNANAPDIFSVHPLTDRNI